MKKVLVLMLSQLLLLSFAACKSGNGAETPKTEEKPAATDVPAANTEPAGLTGAIAESPALLTSGGQSADYQMIATVMTKQSMNFTVNNLATSKDLEGFKTLIVVVGGSSKGLGAAGIDADQELSRLNELLKGAKEQGVTVIAMHTGGEARRGDLSDKFVEPVFSLANYAIIVKDGDGDGLMSGICTKNGIPFDAIESISDVVTILPAAFQ